MIWNIERIKAYNYYMKHNILKKKKKRLRQQVAGTASVGGLRQQVAQRRLRLAATPAALAAATSVMTGAQLSIVLVAGDRKSVV